MELNDLIRKVRSYNKEADFKLIREAYRYADSFHKGKKRVSGEAYIQHPLNAAFIIAELKLDAASVVAALLHDVVEDADASLEEIKEKFGEEIASLVDGVTKIKEIKYERKRDVETIRKMLIATTRDIRVIIIKLADKLHNMRTVSYLPEDKIKRICRETLDIYAPLASRLGIATIKWELEDLAFKHLYPKTHHRFKEKFGKSRKEREIDIHKIKSMIEKELKKNNIKASIVGRPKHFYSIYRKMISVGRSFEEIHDLIALRITTDNVRNCYEILGIIHNLWTPIPGEFDDYIAMPKPNMYQSLHTAVMALNQPVEFQIRTDEMDKIAEEGIAAHWRYKGLESEKDFDTKLSWLRQILDWQKESKTTKEFMEYLKIDFFEDEIYVFTPKGDIITLPRGSCPIDFAYAVHSSIGDRCQGAIVNGRIVPLRYQLKNGDIVNILTSKTPNPKRDWLKIVETAKAKTKIKSFIREHQKIPIAVVKKKEPLRKEVEKRELVDIKNVDNPNINLAKCCSPIPGDKIFAYNIKGRAYSAHKDDCKNLRYRKKKIEASWKDNIKDPINIKIIAYDRVGLFADILNTVAATGTNVNPAKAKIIGNDMAECNLGIIPENTDHIKDLISRIKRIKSVNKVSIEYLNEN